MIRKFFDPFSYALNSVRGQGLIPVMKVAIPFSVMMGIGIWAAPTVLKWTTGQGVGARAHEAVQRGRQRLEAEEGLVTRQRARLRSLPRGRDSMFEGEVSLDPILGTNDEAALRQFDAQFIEEDREAASLEESKAGGFTTAMDALFGEQEGVGDTAEKAGMLEEVQEEKVQVLEESSPTSLEPVEIPSQKEVAPQKVPAKMGAAASTAGFVAVSKSPGEGEGAPFVEDKETEVDAQADENMQERAFPNTEQGKKELLATMFAVGGQSEEKAVLLANTLFEGANSRELDVMFAAALVAAKSRMRKDFDGKDGVGYFGIRPDEGEKIARLAKVEWKGDTALQDPEYNLSLGMDYVRVMDKSLKGNERYISIAFHVGFWRFIEIVKNKEPIPEASETFAKEVAKFKAQLLSRFENSSVGDVEVVKAEPTPPKPSVQPTETKSISKEGGLKGAVAGEAAKVQGGKEPVEEPGKVGQDPVRKRLPNRLGLERAELVLKSEMGSGGAGARAVPGRPGR